MKTTLLSLKAFFTICLLCLVGGVNVMAQDTETVDFTTQGYTDKKPVPEKYNGTDFQITFSKGSGATAPTFYKNASDGDAIRLYKSNSISISSSTKKIKEISFTYGKGGSKDTGYKSTSGSYSTESKKWTSSKPEEGVSSVTLTTPSTIKNYRLQQVTVTFVGGTNPETPTPTITPASMTFSESFEAKISCTDAAAKIYYTLDGNIPDANSTPYTTGTTITIPEATTTLKAVAIKDGKASKVAEAVYTYVAPVAPTYTYTIWSEDWSSYETGNIPSKGKNATYECKNGKSATKIYTGTSAGGTSPELLISRNNGSLTINVTSLKGYSGTLYFSFLTNNDNFTVTSTTTDVKIGEPTKEGGKKYIYTYAITVPEGTEGLNLKITNINPDKGDNMRVDNLSLSAKLKDLGTGSFTITSAQYGTYYTEDAFIMPEGVTGYTITDKNGESLALNPAYPANKVVPAKTALLLKADEKPAASKDFTYTIVNSDEVAPAGNLLHGSVEEDIIEVEGAKAYYKLANDPKYGLGFYWAEKDGGICINNPHKAILVVMSETLSQMRGFSFESMTTNINNVVANTNNSKNAVIYDLNGRRVNSLNAAKGVYIVNGKKVIVK